MKRSDFLKTLGLFGIGMTGLNQFLQAADDMPYVDFKTPALFIGHGSPMNIVADNSFTRDLKSLGQTLERPKAILVISAHWLTRGTYITSAAKPVTIHDFYGFPDELYTIDYPAPGTPGAAELTSNVLKQFDAMYDNTRGLDHGAWSVLHHMYPEANIPVYQMSIDRSRSLEEMFVIGKKLQSLREKGILVIGSGNITHNLSIVDPNEDAPVLDWAEEFDARVMNMLDRQDAKALVNYQDWGQVSKIAHPSNDHYLPLLYAVGLRLPDEPLKYVHEGFAHGSISMRCVQFG